MKKLKIIQTLKNLMFQVNLIFFDWILIKQIIVSSTSFYCWRKQIFKKMVPGGMSNSPLPRVWWQKLGREFWVGRGAWVKMPRFNGFSRSVNTRNLKIFPTHGGTYIFERKFNKHYEERKPKEVYKNTKVSLRLIMKGTYLHCLPCCWF